MAKSALPLTPLPPKLTKKALLEEQSALSASVRRVIGDGEAMRAQAERLTETLAHTAKLLTKIRGSKLRIETLLLHLPRDILLSFDRQEFLATCNERFDAVDVDGSGDLTPDELLPMLMEMSDTAPWEVTWDQLVAFVDIFDENGDGVIDREEFVKLTKFMIIGALVEAVLAAQEAMVPVPALPGGMTFDALIEKASRDKKVIDELIPNLPEDIYLYLTSPAFLESCDAEFDRIDADGSGA